MLKRLIIERIKFESHFFSLTQLKKINIFVTDHKLSALLT